MFYIGNLNQIYLFIICLIIKVTFSIQSFNKYEMKIKINQKELDYFYFEDNGHNCRIWVPSLFNPILLVPNYIEIRQGDMLSNTCKIKNALLNDNKIYTIKLFKYINFFNQKANLYLGMPLLIDINHCYFGLSLLPFNCLEGISNLNLLKKNGQIDKKIFSFDMWDINGESISTNFYLGNEHEAFKSNKGIIGNCKSNNHSLWGCQFDEIIFNNISISLKNSTNNIPYKTYFAFETYDILFPKIFESILKYKTNYSCEYNQYLSCKNFFIEKDYIPIELSNENMAIKGEIDNINRFCLKDIKKINYTRIRFLDIDYIVLPLIVFKKFHIQFDGENNIISFYTLDKSILQIKQKENNEEKSSLILGLILALIIVIVLIFGFTAFYFIKKRKNENEEINNLNEIIDTKNN